MPLRLPSYSEPCGLLFSEQLSRADEEALQEDIVREDLHDPFRVLGGGGHNE